MYITYKFRMYHSRKTRHITEEIDIAGRIWNHCVAFQRTYYRLYKKICPRFKLSGHITKLRRRNSEWRKVGAQSVQCLIERLDIAYSRFINWHKTRVGPRCGLPGFKKVTKYSSVTRNQSGWKLLEPKIDRSSNIQYGRVRLSGRDYKFVQSRQVEGEIKTVTVKRDTRGCLWVCFIAKIPPSPKQSIDPAKTAGFDFGLKDFLTSDDGSTIQSPQWHKFARLAIARLDRSLSRKIPGSGNHRKAKRLIANKHRKVASQRLDWMYKLSHALLERYDALYFEDLSLGGMMALWGRKVTDLAFGKFIITIKHVAEKTGKHVYQVSQWEPTTKTCSLCGHIQAMGLNDRIFNCGSCNAVIQRDVNAARNIKRLGHEADGLGSIRPLETVAIAVGSQEFSGTLH